jgi:hypothetical protein
VEDALTIYCLDSSWSLDLSGSLDSQAWGASDSSWSLDLLGLLDWSDWSDSSEVQRPGAWLQGLALRHTSRPHLSGTARAAEGNGIPAESWRRR